MYWLYFRDDSDESTYGRILKSFFQYNLNKISNLHCTRKILLNIELHWKFETAVLVILNHLNPFH